MLCDGGEMEDVIDFILECEEFEQDRWELLGWVKGIAGERCG